MLSKKAVFRLTVATLLLVLGAVGRAEFEKSALAAVTLASFTATGGDGQVLLEWETASEINNIGFNLWRSTSETGNYGQINDWLIPSKALGSVVGAYYSYVDSDVINGTTYYYKLENVDAGGSSEFYGPITATPGGQPTATDTPTPTPTNTPTITNTSTATPTSTSTPTTTSTPTSTVTPPPGTITVDDLDDGFIQHGTPRYWRESSIGYHGHMFWTYVNGDTIDNWAEWRPGLLPCGLYQVSVFVPRLNATTQSAQYEVHHADDTEVVVVKQLVYYDEWVPLGTYRFGDSAEEHVRLTDATGEDPNTLRQVGFDAIKWELEGPCGTATPTPTPTTTATPTPTATVIKKVYLPILLKGY